MSTIALEFLIRPFSVLLRPSKSPEVRKLRPYLKMLAAVRFNFLDLPQNPQQSGAGLGRAARGTTEMPYGSAATLVLV